MTDELEKEIIFACMPKNDLAPKMTADPSRIAAFVREKVAEEREACAELADKAARAKTYMRDAKDDERLFTQLAAAIRARGEKGGGE